LAEKTLEANKFHIFPSILTKFLQIRSIPDKTDPLLFTVLASFRSSAYWRGCPQIG